MTSELELLIGNDYKKLDKYNEDIREDIDRRLLHIIKVVNLDKNLTREIYKTIIKYNGKSGLKIVERLNNAVYRLENKNAVVEISKILSLDEIVNTVGRYGEEAAPEIAEWLGEATISLRDKDAVIEISKILSLDEIVNTVGRYKTEAKEIAYGLGGSAFYLRDKDAVIEIGRTVEKYRKRAAPEIAKDLKNSAELLKDKDAVIEISKILSLDEIVNTVGRYGEEAAPEIAHWLWAAALYLRDKDAVVEISRIVGKYGEEAAPEIAECLKNAVYKLRDKDAVIEISKILSLDEIVNTVGRYKKGAKTIAHWICETALSLKDKDAVIRASRTVGRYGEEAAPEIATLLGSVAYNLKDKDVVVEISKILSLDEIVNTVGRYGEEAAPEIATLLGSVAYNLKDKDVVVEISKILSLDEIVNTIRRYEGESEEIAYWLGSAAYELRDKDAVVEISKTIKRYGEKTALEIATLLGSAAFHFRDKNTVIDISKILSLDEIVNTIGKYGEEVAPKIAYWLGEAIISLKDKDAVVEISKTIKRYGEKTALEIATLLGSAAFHFRDKDKMLRACRLIDIGEREFTRHVELNDLENVLNEGLDRLVEDKPTLNAVLTYNLSKKELPKPDENNIKDYEHVIMSHLNDKYGVKRPLNLSQIMLFYSIPAEQRNEMTDYINSSEEKTPIFYSMNGINNDNDSIKYSKEELKQYSVISVIGSKNKQIETEAKRIIGDLVGDKKVNQGNSAFYSDYKAKLSEIIGLVRNKDYDGAYEVLFGLNDENISDVLNASNYRDYDSPDNSVIKAVESKNPFDYDSKVQMACVYLPNPRKNGISEYCEDDNIILIRYDIGGESLGSAICYKEDDKFLVDSVEGHRRFRKTKIYDIVYEDLLMRAKEYGAKEVLFGLDALNETAKGFTEHLSKKTASKTKIDMRLNTKAYLETCKGSKAYSVVVPQN